MEDFILSTTDVPYGYLKRSDFQKGTGISTSTQIMGFLREKICLKSLVLNALKRCSRPTQLLANRRKKVMSAAAFNWTLTERFSPFLSREKERKESPIASLYISIYPGRTCILL